MPVKELAVGYIKKPHGVEGYCKIESFSGENEHLLSIKKTTLRKAEKEITVEIEDARKAGKHVLMKFHGINTPEKIRTLNGWELWVSRESAAPLQEGEYYNADLLHCTLIYNDTEVGTVRDVLVGIQSEYLEIETTEGNIVLVPFLEHYIGTVDVENKVIELKVDWILE